MNRVMLLATLCFFPSLAQAQHPRHLYEGTKDSGTARVTHEDGTVVDVPLTVRAMRWQGRPSPWNYFKLEFRAPGMVFMLDNGRTWFDADYLDPPDFYERIQNHERRYARDQMVLVTDEEYIPATEWDMLHVNGVWGPYDPTAGSNESDYRPDYLDLAWRPETPGLPRWDLSDRTIELIDLEDSLRLSYIGRVVPEPGHWPWWLLILGVRHALHRSPMQTFRRDGGER